MGTMKRVLRVRQGQRDAITAVLDRDIWQTSGEISARLGRVDLTSHAVAATLRRMVAGGLARERARDEQHREYAAVQGRGHGDPR